MNTLNKTFVNGSVLNASELQAMVSKINELVAAINSGSGGGGDTPVTPSEPFSWPVHSEAVNAGVVTEPGIYTNMNYGRPTTAGADGDTTYTLFQMPNDEETQLCVGNTSGKVWFRYARVEIPWTLMSPDYTTFVKKTDLSSYVKATALSDYVKKTDLAPYAKTSDVVTKAYHDAHHINMSTADITSLQNSLTMGIITDNNGYVDQLTPYIVVNKSNYETLHMRVAGMNNGLRALLTNYEAYYYISGVLGVGDGWYSKNIREYLTDPDTHDELLRVGDVIKFVERRMKPSEYMARYIDFSSISVDNALFSAYKLFKGKSGMSDGDFIAWMMDNDMIYGSTDNTNYYHIAPDGYITVYDYITVPLSMTKVVSSIETLDLPYERGMMPSSLVNFNHDSPSQCHEYFQNWWSDPKPDTASMTLGYIPANSTCIVELYAFYRESNSALTSPAETHATIASAAGDGRTYLRADIPTLYSGSNSISFPDNLNEARAAFDRRQYLTTIVAMNNSGNELPLVIKVAANADTIASWCCVGGVQISQVV